MAYRTYTRTYSNSSVGKFVSGKGSRGGPLSDDALREEFGKHSQKSNREFTALVSGSDRIVDSVTRAFSKHHEDGESRADIWIAFIEVPPNDTTTRIHSARELAERCKLEEPGKFSHEVIFEWAIPEKYVVHEVSLQTLIERGFQEHYFLRPSTCEVRSTSEVRYYTAQEFKRHDPWGVGVTIGFFAQTFGARAPLDWIAHQLFYDCVKMNIPGEDVVWLTYAPHHTDYASQDTEIVDFQFLCDLDKGIKAALIEWFLSDIDFCTYQEIEEWRAETEDSMAREVTECWETWHCYGTTAEISNEEEILYDKAMDQLLVKHKTQRDAIEAQAVKIGCMGGAQNENRQIGGALARRWGVEGGMESGWDERSSDEDRGQQIEEGRTGRGLRDG
ncbi:hypothetical protein V494_02645 [Pseudogymnoascus sp. VKM F-4513 (FW-928)]|nr:hypothetical protein V494_02645 [Pseudogymnoascus sp. VKM F-4513 (FW-928)]